MSLLMDALKKAEEAKRQSEAAARAAPQEPTLSPATSAVPPAETEAGKKGLPELPTRLELLDHEFQAATPAEPVPTRAAPSAASVPQQQERAAAQKLFDAKQPPSRKRFPIVVGALTLLAAAGIGAYFWWQLQPKGGLALAPGGTRSAPVAPAPATQTAGPAATPAAAAAPAQMAPAATEPPAPQAPAAIVPEKKIGSAQPPQPGGPVSESAAPIRITTGRLQVNPEVARAYQALLGGNLASAERDYEQVLKSEPKNAEALHGLATIALRRGQPDVAEDYFLRAIEADPKDNAAQAGLISLKGQLDPIQSESRLKTLLAAQPDSPSLNFTLGNLLAQQGRWNEAQQAYFRAYTADSENPDYLFNLAVSLDQLRQPKLALQYYQIALTIAKNRPAAFDGNTVAARVRELQQ